jgi:hypothetical protein
MDNIKLWKDVNVGDTVYFADEFADPEPVVVEKIEPGEWNRYLYITVSGPSFNDETRVARVVSPSHDKSLNLVCRKKDDMLAGRLYTSVEAYKDVWNESLHEQLEKLEKDRANIEERIAHIKGDIETVANIKAE